MQRLAHARRLRARNELAEQDDALGVGGPLRRLLAERRVQCIDERFGGRGYRGLLPCVHRRPPFARSLRPSYALRSWLQVRSRAGVKNLMWASTSNDITTADCTAEPYSPHQWEVGSWHNSAVAL